MRHSKAEEQAEVQHRVCVEGSEWRQDKSTVPLLLVMVLMEQESERMFLCVFKTEGMERKKEE